MINFKEYVSGNEKFWTSLEVSGEKLRHGLALYLHIDPAWLPHVSFSDTVLTRSAQVQKIIFQGRGWGEETGVAGVTIGDPLLTMNKSLPPYQKQMHPDELVRSATLEYARFPQAVAQRIEKIRAMGIPGDEAIVFYLHSLGLQMLLYMLYSETTYYSPSTPLHELLAAVTTLVRENEPAAGPASTDPAAILPG